MGNNNNKTTEQKEESNFGTLYIVSTPIGNQEDITLRAIRVLKKCDLVVCEEIKNGSRVLHRLNISKKLDTMNEHNENEKTFELIGLLKKGKKIALISDAGTPVFADPGISLVREALRLNIPMEVVPGVSSIMTALVRCGFPIKQFLYAGFLSRNKEERLLQLKRLSDESRTVVLLETPYRLIPILEAASRVMPDRNAYIGVNLTMPYETHHYGTFLRLYEKFKGQRFKAEFVICFEGKPIGAAFLKGGERMKFKPKSKHRGKKFIKKKN